MNPQSPEWEILSQFLRGLGYGGPVLNSHEFRGECLRYLSLLRKKNEELNLTAVKDLESAFWKHLADSLALLSLEPLGELLDWGSGGGLPGIPMALARKFTGDAERVLFLDSVGKKMRAVEEFTQALELPRTKTLIGRGENLLRSGSLQSVRTVVMRAVAPPERAVKWLDPRIPQWIFFLGPSQREAWESERATVRRKGMDIYEEKTFSLPHGLGERCLMRVSTRST